MQFCVVNIPRGKSVRRARWLHQARADDGFLLRAFAERFDLPFEAARGGKATTYPEYQMTLKQLMARVTKKPTE
jgi:hypothetical protein